jgi:hypothetical protein
MVVVLAHVPTAWSRMTHLGHFSPSRSPAASDCLGSLADLDALPVPHAKTPWPACQGVVGQDIQRNLRALQSLDATPTDYCHPRPCHLFAAAGAVEQAARDVALQLCRAGFGRR